MRKPMSERERLLWSVAIMAAFVIISMWGFGR